MLWLMHLAGEELKKINKTEEDNQKLRVTNMFSTAKGSIRNLPIIPSKTTNMSVWFGRIVGLE